MLLNLINNSKLSYNLSLALRQQLFPNFTLNNFLNLLPTELIEEIASNLDIEDLVNLCQSNIKYQYLCSDPYLINKVKIKDLNTYYNRSDILEILIKYRKDISKDQLNNIFKWASSNGNPEIIKLLLTDLRVNPAVQGNEAIIQASKNGHLEVVRLLLADERINPAAQGNEAIRCASKEGHSEVVRLLLTDERVNPAAQANYAIRCASRNGHIEIVRLLLSDVRVNPAERGNEVIRWANRNGHKEIVKLLSADVRINPSHLIYEEFLRYIKEI